MSGRFQTISCYRLRLMKVKLRMNRKERRKSMNEKKSHLQPTMTDFRKISSESKEEKQ